MSFDEHVKLGNTLKNLQHQLSGVLNCFGVSSKEARLLWKVISGGGDLGELKCLLDDVVCRDYPDGQPEKIYYGSSIDTKKASLGGPLRPIGKNKIFTLTNCNV